MAPGQTVPEARMLHGVDDDDGSFPMGSLVIGGSTLYGMTARGGSRCRHRVQGSTRMVADALRRGRCMIAGLSVRSVPLP